jgi:AcrR family transcriptional regulator
VPPSFAVKAAPDTDVARNRREQIIAAAVEIITSQGLHNLSLSKIETRAGMKRGQLTYYFPTKEEILLAVFDRLLLLMCQQMGDGHRERPHDGNVWECVQQLLRKVLSAPPRIGTEFHALQYTFLAQIAHRDDFREKLASVYAEWRDGIASHWKDGDKPAVAATKHISGRTVSSFVQALVHGLTVQLAADPDAFDRTEMLELCLSVLAPLFHPDWCTIEPAKECSAFAGASGSAPGSSFSEQGFKTPAESSAKEVDA